MVTMLASTVHDSTCLLEGIVGEEKKRKQNKQQKKKKKKRKDTKRRLRWMM